MELEVWHAWEGTPEEELVWLAAEQFEAQHPDVTLRVLGNPAGELEDLYATRLVAGEPPDLVLLNNNAIPLWATQGWLQPLGDLETAGALSHILPSALETVRYDDQLWAIPFQASTVALYYNREALPDPPADIDELLAMVDEGYTLAIPDHIYYLYGFVQAYSGQVDANETLRVDRKSIINYLNFARDLIWHEYTLYGPAGEVGDAFSQGEAQMIVDGVWTLPTYREALGDALGVTLLPYVPEMGSWPEPVLGTSVSLMPPSIPDEERELALTFALFLTEDAIQRQIVELGQAVPVNTGIPVEDAQLNVFLKQATIANPGPLHTEQGLIWDVLQRMQEKVVAEQERVETAAESAEKELRSAGGGE
jgi:arabinogalactan oligomer/maltooligosaccharide transport system substrate-binding protein